MLLLLNPWTITEMQPASVVSINILVVGVHLNWLNWLYFLILWKDPLIIPIACMIFVSPVLDARWYKDLYVNNFFASMARLWAPLYVISFPFLQPAWLQVQSLQATVVFGYFLFIFPISFPSSSYFFLVVPHLVDAVLPCVE